MSKKIFIIVVLISLVSCFGGSKHPGSVSSYYNGVVRTRGGSFRIGALPRAWERRPLKYRALLFANKNDNATITIDSWCKGAVDDGSLASLTKDLYKGMDTPKIVSQAPVKLSGREALKTQIEAGLDGRRVSLTAVVLKMNTCVFDFLYITVPGEFSSQGDFENMINGFEFIDGPSVL